MIVVFVVDTSPSMGRPAAGDGSLTRLDVAKMAVEDFIRQSKKMRVAAAGNAQQQQQQRNLAAIGQLPSNLDQFLLLSTSRQYPETAACAAGGRLLVGFEHFIAEQQQQQQSSSPDQHHQTDPLHHHQQQIAQKFQRQLKGLKVATVQQNHPDRPFPEDAGGATGLNAALSAGLQLLSRYRLQHRNTENFGMGRIPNAGFALANGSAAVQALQPACLVLITDGACLRLPPKQGGGSLQLQYGARPLREFYQEPFRWDQRIFVQAVGAKEGITSTQYLHPHLRTLSEVTGGAHWVVRGSGNLHSTTEALLKHVSPPMPQELPLPDPLYHRIGNPMTDHQIASIPTGPGTSFVNGGPVCCFQSLEVDEQSGSPRKLRAMLLYVGSEATSFVQQDSTVLSQPIWCIPESFFPSKKLDMLPPRPAQPILMFSKYPANLGSKSFEASHVIKMLHRLDQMIAANRKITGQPVKLLHRDVYVCEWLDPEGAKPVQVSLSSRQEYFPVYVPGAGRPSLSDDGDCYLNIGILHVPQNSSTLSFEAAANRLATLTLLPPEPHILLPLLIRLAEMEHRALKKAEAAATKSAGGVTGAVIQKQIAAKTLVPIDEHWRSEFRAYLFRLPPYYQYALKRCLRPVMPSTASSLLLSDGGDMAMQCFSKVCAQKIRNGEQIAKDTNERIELQEESLRRSHQLETTGRDEKEPALRYGQYDPRAGPDSYLAALRNLPAPWLVAGSGRRMKGKGPDTGGETTSAISENDTKSAKAINVLGDLPAKCLMAYYESRRRWIFGGPGLTTRGLHVEGVRNDGSNSQQCGSTPSETEECLLSIAGVGVSTLNQTSTTKMGEYRERLLFSRSPIVGYGSNDSCGVASTTAIDGSPTWSVDDDAMPMAFFDAKTGEFSDSVQARIRAKLMVNFGNPYKEKRADSLIPEKYQSQAPSMQQGGFGSIVENPRTPPGSPPHDSFDSVEEDEAIFVRKSPSRKSPRREEHDEEPVTQQTAKRPRTGSDDRSETVIVEKESEKKPPAPPKPARPSNVATKQPPPPRRRSSAVPPPPPPKKAPPPPPKSAPARPSAKAPPPKPPPQQKQQQPPPKAPPLPTPKPAMPPCSEEQEKSISPPTASKPKVPAQPQVPVLDLESPDVKPNVDLPPGWMCVWSKSQKRWYFFDTKTNKSVWKWPP